MSNWYRLEHLSACVIKGADADAFCQSQFTADIAAIPKDVWQITAWCTRKGRVRTVILVARRQGRVEIVLPAPQIAVVNELTPYTIGRKVELEVCNTVSGSLEPDPGSSRIGAEPILGLRIDQDSTAPLPAQDWIHQWRLAELRAGLAWLDERTRDRFLPQALGLENNHGLSYSKGCYPGQEVVARVHYLGKAPEKLIGLLVDAGSDALPTDLAELSCADARDQPITLLGGVQSGDRWMALAVGSRELQVGDEVKIHGGIRSFSGQVTPADSLC
jgi:folate-binding protein YgfZ